MKNKLINFISPLIYNFSILLNFFNNFTTENFIETSSSLSTSYKVIYAIKNYLINKVFKFYNVSDFQNYYQLNFYVLQPIIDLIKQEDLTYFSEKLFYNLEKLKIINYINHNQKNLKIRCAYFKKEFILDLNLANNFDNQDLIKTLKNYWIGLKDTDNPVFFSWSNPQNLINKIQLWIKNKKNWPLYINQIELNFNPINLQITGFDLKEWKLSQKITIFFDYDLNFNDSIIVSNNNVINENQLSNLLTNIIFDSGLVFFARKKR